MDLKNTQRIEPLDSLRGIAALLVLVYHLKYIYGLPIHETLGFFIGRMSFGVPLFFTLSSFSIFYSLRNREFSVKIVQHYFIRRFFRIAPLYYCLIFIYFIRDFNVFSLQYISNLFLNISFVFGFSPSYHEGLVPAGWSIGIEFIIYLLLPTLFCLIRDYRIAFFAFVLSCVISITLSYEYTTISYVGMSYSYKNVIVMLPFFFLGILLYYLYMLNGFVEFVYKHIFWIFILLIFSIVVIYCTYYYQLNYPGRITDLIVQTRLYLYVTIPCFFFVILMQVGRPISLLHNKFFNYARKWSYSIYLFHPLVFF